MLFNSFQFLLFFPVVTLLHFALPHRYRWGLLLFASCVFYSAFIPYYLIILLVSILIDYYAAILIEPSEGKKRKTYLVVSIISNLALLSIFKYFNFFTENFNELLLWLGVGVKPIPYLHIILPIGLSFHTFQAMSYTIEVYRRNQVAERNFGIYSLYVMFFPQLVAGPIERPQNMLHQFYEEKIFSSSRLMAGLQQMGWGLFKKAVVADQLSIYVNSIYNHWELNTGATLLFATYCFAFQIYCDFSGYSDIAQGSAHILGFRLMDNFNLPYFSKTVTEFWRRWHISLSSWLKDYLYIPLGGNRFGKFKTYRNLLYTMLLGGLWHGASWNFIVWGFLNGAFLSAERILNIKETTSSSWPVRAAKIFMTFNLIALTWIFFRSVTLHQSIGIVKNIFTANGFWNLRIQDSGIFAGMSVAVGLLLAIEFLIFRKQRVPDYFSSRSMVQSIAWTSFFVLMLVLLGVSEGDQFIYFQF
ncbi:MAG: MBOAT family protein [Bacteroidetes bacterium]|nr:MBOAT family protein [Bacteroidota bacterium]